MREFRCRALDRQDGAAMNTGFISQPGVPGTSLPKQQGGYQWRGPLRTVIKPIR